MLRLLNRANDGRKQDMPTWSKAILRTIGALDSILSIFGLYLLLDPISRGLFALNADAPYFRTAFVAMILNGALLLLFVFSKELQFRLKKSGVTAHTTASVLLVAYDLMIAAFWAYRRTHGNERRCCDRRRELGNRSLSMLQFSAIRLSGSFYGADSHYGSEETACVADAGRHRLMNV